MIDLKIDAKLPKSEKDNRPEDRIGNLTVQFPDMDKDPDAALGEAVKSFGSKAILSNAKANWVITLQGNIRSRLKKGQSNEQIQADLGSAKMGVAIAKVAADPKANAIAFMKTLTPEQRKAFIQELMK
jgi:hypothetical protein